MRKPRAFSRAAIDMSSTTESLTAVNPRDRVERGATDADQLAYRERELAVVAARHERQRHEHHHGELRGDDERLPERPHLLPQVAGDEVGRVVLEVGHHPRHAIRLVHGVGVGEHEDVAARDGGALRHRVLLPDPAVGQLGAAQTSRRRRSDA